MTRQKFSRAFEVVRLVTDRGVAVPLGSTATTQV